MRDDPQPIRDEPPPIRDEPPPIRDEPPPIKEEPPPIRDEPPPLAGPLAVDVVPPVDAAARLQMVPVLLAGVNPLNPPVGRPMRDEPPPINEEPPPIRDEPPPIRDEPPPPADAGRALGLDDGVTPPVYVLAPPLMA